MQPGCPPTYEIGVTAKPLPRTYSVRSGTVSDTNTVYTYKREMCMNPYHGISQAQLPVL